MFDLGHGFTASGILVTRSGFPYTAIVEDGTDTNGDANDANERVILNGSISGRFSQRQPFFANLDMRLLKAFRFSETKRFEISAEVYNLTRNTNKGYGPDAIKNYCTTSTALATTSNPLAITCPAGFLPLATASDPTSAPSTARFGGPRQIQLGARFIF